MDAIQKMACDAGGPIKAGDNVYCHGPYISKKKNCDCVMIALNDADFSTLPLMPILVFTPHPFYEVLH